jgi:hypothetical protein
MSPSSVSDVDIKAAVLSTQGSSQRTVHSTTLSMTLIAWG